MQCRSCGAPLMAGALACGHCGLAVAPSPPQPPAQPQPPARAPLWQVWSYGPPRPWPPPPGGPRGSRAGLVFGAVLLALLVVGGVVATVLFVRKDEPAPKVEQPVATTTADPTPFEDFSAVYATVHDGVGQVMVETCEGAFSGTAFLVSPTLMATAAHVIEDASSLQVELEGSVFPAEVYGVDLSHDLALIELSEQVDGHVFSFAPQDPEPGTRIAAIGFPLGEPKTLTEGTVSGLDRHINTRSGSYDGLLQTDTAINPGNSGGPLLDINGHVVGVADAIRPDAEGIGFAVPATIASGLTSTTLQTQPLATCP